MKKLLYCNKKFLQILLAITILLPAISLPPQAHAIEHPSERKEKFEDTPADRQNAHEYSDHKKDTWLKDIDDNLGHLFNDEIDHDLKNVVIKHFMGAEEGRVGETLDRANQNLRRALYGDNFNARNFEFEQIENAATFDKLIRVESNRIPVQKTMYANIPFSQLRITDDILNRIPGNPKDIQAASYLNKVFTLTLQNELAEYNGLHIIGNKDFLKLDVTEGSGRISEEHSIRMQVVIPNNNHVAYIGEGKAVLPADSTLILDTESFRYTPASSPLEKPIYSITAHVLSDQYYNTTYENELRAAKQEYIKDLVRKSDLIPEEYTDRVSFDFSEINSIFGLHEFDRFFNPGFNEAQFHNFDATKELLNNAFRNGYTLNIIGNSIHINSDQNVDQINPENMNPYGFTNGEFRNITMDMMHPEFLKPVDPESSLYTNFYTTMTHELGHVIDYDRTNNNSGYYSLGLEQTLRNTNFIDLPEYFYMKLHENTIGDRGPDSGYRSYWRSGISDIVINDNITGDQLPVYDRNNPADKRYTKEYAEAFAEFQRIIISGPEYMREQLKQDAPTTYAWVKAAIELEIQRPLAD